MPQIFHGTYLYLKIKCYLSEIHTSCIFSGKSRHTPTSSPLYLPTCHCCLEYPCSNICVAGSFTYFNLLLRCHLGEAGPSHMKIIIWFFPELLYFSLKHNLNDLLGLLQLEYKLYEGKVGFSLFFCFVHCSVSNT